MTAETDFNDAVTTFERDPAGHVIRRTNAVGQTLTYTYDTRGNLITEHTSDGTTTRYANDPNGNLTHATTPDVDLTLTRDPLGRITTETVNGHTLTTAYDPLGHPVLRRTPSGALSIWDHDPAGRPVTLATGLTGGPALQFEWDAAGRPTGRRFGATTLDQAFDPVGRLLTQTLTNTATPTTTPNPRPADPLLRRDYGYSIDGLLTGLDDLHTGVHRYTHDPTGQVTNVLGPTGDERYDYDPSGNLTHATWPTPGDDPDPGPRGPREYTGTLITRAGNTTYRHDRAGRLTQRHQKLLCPARPGPGPTPGTPTTASESVA